MNKEIALKESGLIVNDGVRELLLLSELMSENCQPECYVPWNVEELLPEVLKAKGYATWAEIQAELVSRRLVVVSGWGLLDLVNSKYWKKCRQALREKGVGYLCATQSVEKNGGRYVLYATCAEHTEIIKGWESRNFEKEDALLCVDLSLLVS